MSWLYSRALVEEYSAATYSDGEPSALSKSTPTPQAYCAPDKMTGFSRLSRFGMIFAPLTGDRGAELLTLYLEASHARTSALPGKALASTESVLDCGEKCAESLARYDPDTHLLRTAQRSLLGGYSEYSATLPRWGTMCDGELYRLPTLVRRTCENAFGFWLTPRATDTGKGEKQDTFLRRMGGSNRTLRSITGGSSERSEDMANTNSGQREGMQRTIRVNKEHSDIRTSSWWGIEPDVGRVANGVAARVDRLKAIGNGQVPAVAATSFRILLGEY